MTGVSDTIKSELKDLCKRIAKLLGVRKGSVEIHCYKGEPKEVHVCDKSIKLREQDADRCKRIAKLLGVRKGSIKIYCYKGEPRKIDVHDKSIKFEESKNA